MCRPCRQPGGRPDALHVENHRGNFRVISEAGELRHQRDARSRGGRHRPRARPACANHHAERGNLVLGLDDGKRRLAILVDPVLLHVGDHRLAQRGRGRDRVPRDDRAAGHHAPDGSRGVALDEDHPLGLVHPLDVEGVALWKVLLGVVPTGLERGHVHLRGFGLLAQLLHERLLHLAHVDVEELGQDAVVDHVAHEPAALGVRADGRHELVERHRVEGQVLPQRTQLQRFVVHDRRTRLQGEDVFLGGLGIHRDDEVDFLLASDVALLVRPDGVPRGQPRDVRGEHVLARHRDTHLEN